MQKFAQFAKRMAKMALNYEQCYRTFIKLWIQPGDYQKQTLGRKGGWSPWLTNAASRKQQYQASWREDAWSPRHTNAVLHKR